MIWHTLTADAVSKKLDTSKEMGLSESQVIKRYEIYGKNEIPDENKNGILKKLINQFNDYMIIILLIAAAVSFAIAIYEKQNDFVEPVVIVFIVLLNAIVGVIQEERAEKALAELKNLTHPSATVIRDGKTQKIKASQLVPGDIIILKSGDFAPADARLIKSTELIADESSLTGESHPVLKDANKIFKDNTPIADVTNMLWSATAITGGNGVAIVTETGINTQVGKIAKAIIESKTPQTPLQNKLEQTGKVLGTIALTICTIVFCIGLFKNIPPMEMFMTSVSLAVAAIPEGLPAIVTIMLALGVQKMAKKNAIVRKLPAVETLGSASVICSDKTGTLTQNKMTVTEIWENIQGIMSYALLCCNNTDSTEKAITEYSSNNHIKKMPAKRVKEIPFSSTTKYMATINEHNGKYIVAVKGAPDILIPKCNIPPEEKRRAMTINEEMTSKGLRVLAVAECETDYIPSNINLPLNLCGLIGISDPPRPEIYEAISNCKKSGIRPVMITGDHAGTASAIARKIGMTPYALTGQQLDRMSDAELKKSIKKYSVFARVTPEHKVKIVKAFQSSGEVVAMTGDGVNDAPALKQADIGCAMGITGTDVAKSASDMILTDDNFATIVSAVHEGRSIFENIKKAVHFLLSSNIGEILTILCAIIAGLPSPLTAVQLLWVNLITDSLPALALGIDKNNMNKIISQKPIKRNKSLFSDGLALMIFLEGIMIGTLALVAFCIGYFRFNSCDIGRTMAFCVLSVSQLVHSLNVRSDSTVFSSRIPKNMFLFGAILLGISLQVFVVVSPTLSRWFSTVMLNEEQWKITAMLSVLPIIVMEFTKLFRIRTNPS